MGRRIVPLEERLANYQLAKRLSDYQSSKAPDADQSDDSDIAGSVETFGRSAAQGSTLGASEPVMSGIQASMDYVAPLFDKTDRDLESKGFKVEEPVLAELYANDVNRRNRLKEAHPYSDFFGNVAGSIAGSKLIPATQLPFKAGEAAAEFIPTLKTASDAGMVTRGLTGAVNVGGDILKSGITGGVGAGLSSVAENATKGSTGFDSSDPLEAAKMGAKLGAGMSALGKVVGGGLKLFGKSVQAASRLSNEDLQYYADNAEKTNSADIEDVKDGIDKVVNKLKDDVSNAKLTYDEAKDILSQANKARAENHPDALHLKDKIEVASKDLKVAQRDAEENLRKLGVPVGYPEEVIDSIDKVKDRLVAGSKKSYELLHGTEIPMVDDALDYLKNQRQGYFLHGVPTGEDVLPAINAIDGKIKMLEAIRGDQSMAGKIKDWANPRPMISGIELKQMIQGLDRETNWSKKVANFDDPRTIALKKYRNFLDTQLKEKGPENYKSFMAQEVAPLADSLDRFSETFGGRTDDAAKSKILSHVANLNDPQISKIEDLKQLGVLSGKDLLEPIRPYVSARKIIGDKAMMRGLKDSLPEVASLSDLQKQHSGVLSKIEEENLLRKANAEKFLKSNQDKLSNAQSALEPVRTWSDQTSQSKINRLGQSLDSNKDIELKRQLDYLQKFSKEDLYDQLRAVRTQQKINSNVTNGSKNVNTGGALGSALGNLAKSAVGGGIGLASGGGIGLGIGVLGGQLFDKYGARLTAEVYKDIQNGNIRTAIDKFSKFAKPEDVKILKNSLIKSYTQSKKSSSEGNKESTAITDTYISPDEAGKAMLRK